MSNNFRDQNNEFKQWYLCFSNFNLNIIILDKGFLPQEDKKLMVQQYQIAEDQKNNDKQQKIRQFKNSLDFEQNLQFGKSLQYLSEKSQIKDQSLKQYFLTLNPQLISEIISNNLNFATSQQQDCKQGKNVDQIINFELLKNLQNILKTDLQRKLIQNNFMLLDKQYLSKNLQLQIKILQHMKNYQIVQLFCQLGFYSKRFTVLHVFQQSPRHRCERIGYGAFGNIYACGNLQNGVYCVKCLKLNKNEVYSFHNIALEFFIVDLMSAMQIGPKLLRKSRFDFVIYPNCLQFQMQLCQEIQIQSLQKDLSMSLFKMHIMKIIHSDIKPANLMYSLTYKKNVFIDFGISKFINKQIWQESQTKFKGTYEFCGQQMRKLYLSHDYREINLFINDAKMLRNSMKNIFKLKQTGFSHFERDKFQQLFKKLNFQNSFEIQVELKFLIYSIETNSLLKNQYMKKIMQIFNNIQSQQKFLRIYRKLVQFWWNFKQDSKNQIIEKIFWKIKIDRKILIQIYDLSFETKNFWQQKQLKKENTIMQLKQFYRNLQQKREISPFQIQFIEINENHKNNKANILFILTSGVQIIKFDIESYFQTALRFLSFFKGEFACSTQQKQATAKTIRQLIQKQHIGVNLQNTHFDFNNLSSQSCFQSKYPSILWIYVYLLRYCMNTSSSNFLKNNLGTILKDCILLGFNYYLFLEQCLEKYFNHMIHSNDNFFVTQSVIILSQMYYLTQNYFLVDKKYFQAEKNKKSKFLIIEIILKLSNNFDALQLKQKFIFSNKIKVFRNIWTLFVSKVRAQTIYEKLQPITQEQKQYLPNLISTIEFQFSTSHDIQKLSYFEKAIRIVYYAKMNLNEDINCTPNSSMMKSLQKFEVQNREFDITKLIELNFEKNKEVKLKLLKYIDDKINSEDISFYLAMPLRLEMYNQRKNEEGLENIWKTIFSKFETALFNYNNYIKMCISTIEIQYFTFNKKWKKYFFKRQFLTLRLAEQFSKDPENHLRDIGQLIRVLQNNVTFKQREREKYEKFKRRFEQRYLKVLERIFKKIYTCRGLCLYTYSIVNEILNILPKASNEYLKFRLDFYRMVYDENQFFQENQFIKNNNYMLTDSTMKVPNKKIPISFKSLTAYNNYRNNIFFSDILQKHQLQQTRNSQIFWNIKKIKNSFFPQLKISTFIHTLTLYLVKKQEWGQLSEALIQYYVECNNQKTVEQFIRFYLQFQIARIKAEKNKCEGHLFLNLAKALRQVNKRQRKDIMKVFQLCPVYLNLLQYEKYLQQNLKTWIKTLLKVYSLYPKFLAFNSPKTGRIVQFSPKNFIYEKIIYCSLKFAQKFKSKRKRNILLKSLVKNLQSNVMLGRKLYKQFYDQFTFQTFKANKNGINYTRLENLHTKKAKKILLNFFLERDKYPIDFSHLQQQFQKYYYIRFYEQPPSKNTWISFAFIEEQQQRQNSYNQQNDKILNQTLRVRQELERMQLQRLNEKLLEQKGKTIKQISWIKLLNQ